MTERSRETATERISGLERELNSFDPAVRARALAALLALAEDGRMPVPEAGGRPARPEISNLHGHSFHSYNAYGFSPSALAWIARREGIGLMGIVDFDTLDGVDEFLEACDTAGVRGTAGIETRVRLSELADRVINSPGEPGVAYMMGIGFARSAPPPEAWAGLENLRARARARNEALVERINARLPEVAIDYERDVVPLSPSATPTERHIVRAYAGRAGEAVADPAAFWAAAFSEPSGSVPATDVPTTNIPISDVQVATADVPAAETPVPAVDVPAGGEATDPAFLGWLRTRLIKQGGIGYLAPGPDTFPPAGEFIRFVEASAALPCGTWLDGTSPSEHDPDALLDLLMDRGIVVLTVIPDRNWNLPDPEERATKIYHLHALAAAARQRGLPLIAGTEMNSPGQRLVDDFTAPALAPLRPAFTDGAYFVWGHTVMERWVGRGWWSGWAGHYLPERRERIAFFTRLGRSLPPGGRGRRLLESLESDLPPEQTLAAIAVARTAGSGAGEA